MKYDNWTNLSQMEVFDDVEPTENDFDVDLLEKLNKMDATPEKISIRRQKYGWSFKAISDYFRCDVEYIKEQTRKANGGFIHNTEDINDWL